MIKDGTLMKLEGLYKYNAQREKVRRISFKDYDKGQQFTNNKEDKRSKGTKSTKDKSAKTDDSFVAFDK